MELKDFIAETFKQIVDGVVEAQRYGAQKGAAISPSNLTFHSNQTQLQWDQGTGEVATMIEFDVAVTSTEATGTKGGVGLFVGPIGLGSQGQSDARKKFQQQDQIHCANAPAKSDARINMTLQEFISDTLSQIVRGVATAKVESIGVAPRVAITKDNPHFIDETKSYTPAPFMVDFDVAVTVSKKTDVETGGGVSVHVVEAGPKGQSSAEHSTVSRIKFQVPITYS